MNQILMVEPEKEKQVKEKPRKEKIKKEKIKKEHRQIDAIQRANVNSNKADLRKIIMIFSIVIIIFGIVLVGKSTYALISNKNGMEDVIEVTADRMGKETKITINSGYPIKEFSYKWNTGELVTLQGDGTVQFETIIQIPNGNNILRMTVKDYYGNEKNFYEQYLYDSSDVTKPTIDISISGTKLNIKAADDTEMSYITYSWGEEEATRIEVDKNNPKEISREIDVPEGQNKLSIIAVDKEGNRETRTENVIGDTKPTFTLSKDGLKIILTASDDQGISKVTMTVDDETKDTGEEPLNMKDLTIEWEVTSGIHTISASVTNVNGLTATQTITAEI